MSPPLFFSIDAYASWRNAQFPADDPLREKVEQLRKDLITGTRGQLSLLAQILSYAANYSINEYEQTRKTSIDYRVSLEDALDAEPDSGAYDLLFKSSPSIVNKLWRKNSKGVPSVHLGNIREAVSDLVRTDITATTLDSAAFLANRMNALPGIIYNPNILKEFNDHIESVKFEPEMKMESGYFAYHGLVRFKDRLIVEVQIYSELMRHWRKLSHALYDRARNEPIKKHEFNSKESRLISLGHLLHLAECQLRQLDEEFAEP